MLDSGFWMLPPSLKLWRTSDDGFLILDSRCWILDARRWTLDYADSFNIPRMGKRAPWGQVAQPTVYEFSFSQWYKNGFLQ